MHVVIKLDAKGGNKYSSRCVIVVEQQILIKNFLLMQLLRLAASMRICLLKNFLLTIV